MEEEKNRHSDNSKLVPLKPQIKQKSDNISNENRVHRRLNEYTDLQSTPFRCSLSHRLAITRGKTVIEQSISRRRKAKPEKETTNEQKTVKRETTEPNPVLLKLPKLSHGARPFVTVSSGTINKHGGIYDFFNPKNARESWETKFRLIRRENSDFNQSRRSYEEVMKSRERHLVSSNLLKSSNVRTTTLPQLVRKNDLTYFEYKNANEGLTDDESSDEDLESIEDFEDFCKTFKDGSKLIGSDRKLSIEVFMPKI